MTGRPNNPYDEAPAAWTLWQFVVTRIPEADVSEFSKAMAGYRDEVRDGTISEPAVRELTVPQVMAFHRLTGQLLDQAQRERWTAAGRCGTCGFDGDRAGCHDCRGGHPAEEQP